MSRGEKFCLALSALDYTAAPTLEPSLFHQAKSDKIAQFALNLVPPETVVICKFFLQFGPLTFGAEGAKMRTGSLWLSAFAALPLAVFALLGKNLSLEQKSHIFIGCIPV